MKGLSYINLGEKIIDVVKNSKSTVNSAACINASCVKKMRLDKDCLIKLAKIDSVQEKEAANALESHLEGIQNWTLDVAHKIKSDCEILFITLKQNGNDIVRGAYSKTKAKRGEVKKFHFAEDDITLHTGYTRRTGKIRLSKKTYVVPKNYQDYMWSLEDRDLFIVSDLFGVFGKQKSIESVCKDWDIRPYMAKKLRNQSLKTLREMIRGGLQPVKTTQNGKYNLNDYVQALGYLRENPVYNYITGRGGFNNKAPIIDDTFLEMMKPVRERMNIVNEWRKSVESVSKQYD